MTDKGASPESNTTAEAHGGLSWLKKKRRLSRQLFKTSSTSSPSSSSSDTVSALTDAAVPSAKLQSRSGSWDALDFLSRRHRRAGGGQHNHGSSSSLSSSSNSTSCSSSPSTSSSFSTSMMMTPLSGSASPLNLSGFQTPLSRSSFSTSTSTSTSVDSTPEGSAISISPPSQSANDTNNHVDTTSPTFFVAPSPSSTTSTMMSSPSTSALEEEASSLAIPARMLAAADEVPFGGSMRATKRRHRATVGFDAAELRGRMEALARAEEKKQQHQRRRVPQNDGEVPEATFNPLYCLGRAEPPQRIASSETLRRRASEDDVATTSASPSPSSSTTTTTMTTMTPVKLGVRIAAGFKTDSPRDNVEEQPSAPQLNRRRGSSVGSLSEYLTTATTSSGSIPTRAGIKKKISHDGPELRRLDSREELPARKKQVMHVGQDLPDAQRKRHMVINEIIDTERDYIADLEVLITVFKEPLAQEGILTKDELQAIFGTRGDLKQLVALNRLLLEDMLLRLASNHEGQGLGESFLLLGDGLKMYSAYCANQAAASQMVSKCQRENAKFRAFLDSRRQLAVTNKLSLRDYLIKPVQRLCKYPLLLRELLKCTDEAQPDHAHLTAALKKLQQVVAVVNDQRQIEEEFEAFAKVVKQLHNAERFGVRLMEPGRKLIQDGTLLARTPEQKDFLPIAYVLFSDLLVLAEPMPKAEKHGKEPGGLSVTDVLSLAEARCRSSLADESSMLEISIGDRVFVIPFNSPDLKRKWMERHAGWIATSPLPVPTLPLAAAAPAGVEVAMPPAPLSRNRSSSVPSRPNSL